MIALHCMSVLKSIHEHFLMQSLPSDASSFFILDAQASVD